MEDKEKKENEENKELEFTDNDMENMSGGALPNHRVKQDHTVYPGPDPKKDTGNVQD